MKKKQKNDKDVSAMMAQIQGQLAVLDQKLDAFMTKSLTELAQALAASRPVVRPQAPTPPPVRPTQNKFHHQRPMYAVICYQCGKDSELPFKPRENRPVYCKECFARRKGRIMPAGGAAPAAAGPSAGSVQQPAAVSVQPAKAEKKEAAGKTARAKKKISRKPAAGKKTTARKKTAVKRKVKKK